VVYSQNYAPIFWANSTSGEEVDVPSLFVSNFDDDSQGSRSGDSTSSLDEDSELDTAPPSCSEFDDDMPLTRGDTRRGRLRFPDGASVAYTCDSAPSYVRSHIGFELAMTGAVSRKT
jgi:hypothetical protein